MNFYENQDEECLHLYDNFLNQIDSQTGQKSQAKIGLVKSLKDNGFKYLLNKFLTTDNIYLCQNSKEKNNQESNELLDLKYYTSWKLGMWQIKEEPITVSNNFESFNKNFYYVLNSLTENIKLQTEDENLRLDALSKNTRVLIEQSEKFLMKELMQKSSVTCELNKVLSRLYYLNETKKYVPMNNCLIVDTTNSSNMYESNYFSNSTDSFELFDDILSLRLELSKLSFNVHKKQMTNSALIYLNHIFENIIDNSINYKKFQVIIKTIFEIRKLKF